MIAEIAMTKTSVVGFQFHQERASPKSKRRERLENAVQGGCRKGRKSSLINYICILEVAISIPVSDCQKKREGGKAVWRNIMH